MVELNTSTACSSRGVAPRRSGSPANSAANGSSSSGDPTTTRLGRPRRQPEAGAAIACCNSAG